MAMRLEHAAVIGGELALGFEDGSEAYFPMAMLRRACPCAACQGEPDALGRVVRPKVVHGQGAYELIKYELVGGYALQLFWGDGHSSGIYTFDYFRRLSELPPSGAQ